MGAIMAGREENCRDKEESLELVVLETVRDVERVKDASLCMRRMDEEKALNSREKVVDIYTQVACLPELGSSCCKSITNRIDPDQLERWSSRLLNNGVT
jgi:hypothetical protein